MYAGASRPGKRPPRHNPTVTAGLKCAPEIGPTAYAMVRTLSPNASATPAKPMPRPGKAAASTALPQPPSTNQNVPHSSAIDRRHNDIAGTALSSPGPNLRRRTPETNRGQLVPEPFGDSFEGMAAVGKRRGRSVLSRTVVAIAVGLASLIVIALVAPPLVLRGPVL